MSASTRSLTLKKVLTNVVQTEPSIMSRNRFLPNPSSVSLESMIPRNPKAQRELLGNILISSNHEWDERTLQDMDLIWSIEKKDKIENGSIVSWKKLPVQASISRQNKDNDTRDTNISIWKGDITLLDAEAITNAANDQGLGCFVPNHRCIDNVIHRSAGPRLRHSCKRVMQDRGYPLSAGTEPIITPAFYLPSQHVIHVTGPQISYRSNGEVTNKDREQLKKAYQGSLDLCAKHNIRSIAFCGISTGIFGFPKDIACSIAITTVLDWLQLNSNHEMDSIIFDVFSEEEEIMYNQTLKQIMNS